MGIGALAAAVTGNKAGEAWQVLVRQNRRRKMLAGGAPGRRAQGDPHKQAAGDERNRPKFFSNLLRNHWSWERKGVQTPSG
eukprot:4672118-Prorocentrum_lima.AAC.1